MTRDGKMKGPYLYKHWIQYGWHLFDLVHAVIEGKTTPKWHQIYFRCEDDFYGGVYSHFYQIFQTMVCKLEGLEVKHGASNDVSRGASLYETLLPKDFSNHKSLQGKGEMHTVPRIHKEYAEQIHMKQVSDFDVNRLQELKYAQTKRNSKRVRLMRKHNRIRKNKTMYYRPKIEQNFDTWYFPLKQTPAWFSYKTKKWQYPPIIKTNPFLEKSQRKLINKTIKKWLISGALFLLPEGAKPDLATPSVFANVQLPNMPPPDPTKKERMCHHGSYEKAIEGFSLPCKLEDLYNIVLSLLKGDKMSKSDDKSGFHLVLLGKESRLLVAFEYEGRFFSYRVCPFGSPPVPAIFQRCNMIVMNYLRTLGVRNSLYLDDRMAMDNDQTIYDGVPRNGWATAALVVAAGGFISLQKSDFEPKPVQEFLGLKLNTDTCEISVPEEKWQKLKDFIIRVIKDGKCTFLDIQKLRGKCVSLILTNPMTKLFIREMNRVIKEANKNKLGNADFVILDHQLKSELAEWLRLDFLKMKARFIESPETETLDNKLTFTDASSFSASALIFDENSDVEIKQWFFDEDTQAEPIYLKEALAILWMLQVFELVLSNKRIIHFCDNQAIVFSYNGLGSKTDKINHVIRLIYIQLNKMGSKLVMYWINTNDQLADEASRFVDFNEEFVPKTLFDDACEKLKVIPTVDVFATPANTKCTKFITFGLISDPNCIAFDFFSASPKMLKLEILWCFPPKNLINQTISHLTKYFLNHRFILIFHSFGELPMGIPNLLQKGGKLVNFSRFPATIIPAEKQLLFRNQLFYGFWNDKIRATKMLKMNC